MVEKGRNNGLDILKSLCIFLIILLHTEALKESFPINVEPICRFAVPCFFMITGFFYSDIVNRRKELKQIIKVLFLISVSNVVLILLNIIYVGRNGIVDWIILCCSKNNIIKMLFFNENLITGHFGSYHIWYLNALLYVLVIAYFLRRLKKLEVLYYLTPLLLIGGFILECFSQQLFGVSFSENGRYYVYRNFLTVGIPYFSIGNLLSHYGIKKLKAKNSTIIIGSLLLIGLSFFEYNMELAYGLATNGEFFLLTPFYATGLFLFFYNAFEGKKLKKIGRIVAFIGERYVIWIYLFHLPVIVLIKDLFSQIGILNPDKLLVSLLTIVISLVVAAGIDCVLSLWKSKNRRKTID